MASVSKETNRPIEEIFEGADEVALTLGRALEANPTSEAKWDEIEEWSSRANAPDGVGALYRKVIATRPVNLETLVARALRFHEEWYAEDADELLAVLESALGVEDLSDTAFQRLTVIFTSRERWSDLLQVYDRRIDATTDDKLRLSLLEEALQTSRDFASDDARSIDYMRRIAALSPKDADNEAALERALERNERWDDLVDLLRTRVAKETGAAAESTRMQIAKLDLERRGRVGAAVEELGLLVASGSSQKASALSLLDSIRRDEAIDTASRRAAIRVLRSVRSAEGDRRAVVDLLETDLTLAAPAERVALDVDAGDALAELGDSEAALAHFVAAFAANPAASDVRDRLRRTSERLGRLDEYVGRLASAAESADPATAGALQAEVAQLRATALGDTEGAIEAYERLLEESSDADQKRKLCRTLADLHRNAGRGVESLGFLEREAKLTPDGAERREVLRESALLASELGLPDRALAAWRGRLDADGADRDALDAIIAILEREQRHAELVTTLRHRISLATSKADERRDLEAVARLEAGPLSNVGASILTWTTIAERFGEDAEVVDALTEAYEVTERAADLVALLERAESREGSHLADVRSRLGDVYRERLGRPVDAVAAYERALDAFPRLASARAGLAQSSEDPLVAKRAIESLSKSYAATEEWEPELALTDARLAAAVDDDARVGILMRAASLAESKGNSPSRAFERVASAFELSPGSVHLESELHRLAALASLPNELANALPRAAARLEDDPSRRAHLFGRASVLAEQHADTAAAFRHALSAFGARPRDLALAQRVASLASTDETRASARDALASACRDESADTALLETLAQVERAARHPGLLDTLARLATRKPRDLDVLAEMTSVALESGDETRVLASAEATWERAATSLRSGIAASGARSADEVGPWALELVLARLERDGELARASRLAAEAARVLGAPHRSALLARATALAIAAHLDDELIIDLQRDVLRESPEDPEAIGALAASLEKKGRLAEILQLRLGELSRADDAERRLSVRLEVVDLVDRIDRASSRFEVLRANLAERPGHAASIEAIATLLRRERRTDELADVLADQASKIGPPASGAMWLRVARLAANELGDEERARRAYESLVEIEPSIEAYDALAAIAQKRADTTGSARWLERRLSVSPAADVIPVSLRLATAQLAQGRRDRAIEVLESAFESHREDVELRARLLELYRTAGATEPLARVAALSAAVETDPARRLALAREAANLYFHVLGRPVDAIPMLELAATSAPEEKQIRVELADAYRHAGQNTHARVVLEKLVEEYGRRRTPERAQIHSDLGRVLEEMGDLDGAIAQLDQATQIAVSNAPMLLALGRLASRAGQVDRAEKTYRTLLMLVRRRSDGDAVDVGVGEVLHELHAIAAGRDESDKATELLDSALEAVATSDGEAVRFVDALVDRGAAPVALRGIEARLSARSGAPDVELSLRHARALEANDRAADALRVLLDAVDAFPSDTRVHTAARASAAKLGKPQRYADAVAAAIGRLRTAEDAETIAKMTLAQASCVEIDVKDPVSAAALYRTLIASSFDSVARGARSGLARTLRAAGDTEGEREVQATIRGDAKASADERLEALYRIAQLDLTDASRQAEAIGYLKLAVQEDGRAARAANMLRRVAESGALDSEGWNAYESLARGAGDLAALVDYLLCRAERPDATMAEIKEAVERALAAGQAGRARSLLLGLSERAEELDAADARAVFLSLASLDETGGEVAGALRWLSRAAELSEPDEARSIRRRIAKAAGQEGGDTALALGAYRGLIDEDPNQPEVLGDWLSLVARLTDADAVDDVLTVVERADLTMEERNSLRFVGARFHASREGGAARCIELLRQILDENATDNEAAQFLESIYEREGYDSERAGLLEARLDALIGEGPSDELVDVALRAAELHRTVDTHAARTVLLRALDVVPRDRGLIEAILTYQGEDDDIRERTELRERLIATEPLDTVARAALRSVADWEALGDEDGMMRALDLGLSRLGDDDVLRPKLEDMIRRRGDDRQLAAFLARRLDAVTDPLERRTLALEAAFILRERLGDPSAAAEVLARVLEGPFDLAAFEEYVACLVAAARMGDAIAAITAALESVGGQDELRTTLFSMRSNLRRATGDLAFALADLESIGEQHRARTFEPMASLLVAIRQEAESSNDVERERHAALRLAQLLETNERVEDARDVLVHHVERQPDDVEAIEWLVRCQTALEDWVGLRVSTELLVARTEGEPRIAAALLYTDASERTGRLERAREVLEHVRVTSGEDRRIVDRLRTIYVAMGEHREVAAMLIAEARTSDDARRFDCLLEAGRLLLETANDPDGAVEPLTEAHGIHPDDMRLTVLLVDAYLAADRLAEAGHLLEHSIASHPKRRTPELSQLQHRMGRYARATGDRDLEMQWFVASLECDKNNVDCAADLANVSMELGDYETALNALRTITLARTEGPISRAMAYLLQAKIAHQRGESRRALLWARKAREVDPVLDGVDAFLRELGENP